MIDGSGRPRPELEQIRRAARRIDPAFTQTPTVRRPSLDEELGCRLLVKVETVNPIRSFKGRGTHWYMLNAGQQTPVVTASAGNFGQGIAYAAKLQHREAIIFAASTANPAKVTAMRRLGARVVQHGNDFDEAMAAALDWSARNACELVVDGGDPRIVEGAGSIALELDQQVDDDIDAVVAPLGNGALVCGLGTWLRDARPATQIVAASSSGAPAMARSWQRGEVVGTPSVDTIADGIAIRVPVPYALEIMRDTVDDIIEVGDEHIIQAMRLLYRHLGSSRNRIGSPV